MQYNDTTNKQGLLQYCEFWCNLGDAGISGNTFLKQQFTNRLNRRYERAMGMLDGLSRLSQSDDVNYINQPFSYFDLVSGQHDYQFLTDADGNSITDITAVLILESTSATEYVKLNLLTLDDVAVNGNQSGHLSGGEADNAELVMSPNPSDTGIPTGYIERNNTVFLSPVPNYSKTNGGKLFYKRVPSYFTTSDTTKQPGFEAGHHQILSLGASLDWLLATNVAKPYLITRIEAELNKAENEFKVYCEMRNPVKHRMLPLITNTR